jgi:chemotaxis methyl-accepting protein methylase
MNWSISSVPELPEQHFEHWRKVIESRVGIRMGDAQKQLFQTQVSLRMRELGETDYGEYFARLGDSIEGRVEWSILVDRLVVKETSFFRHQPSFDVVCEHLQKLINNEALRDSYDVWSVGCSTGEEAYTLAMLVNESFELARVEPYFGVTATDVSRFAVTMARRGIYPERKLDFVPNALRYKYFNPADIGGFEFDHETSNRICFSCANIIHVEDFPDIQFDVVFCQNLLVYFPQQLRHDILDAIVGKMKPGALLVIGLGEVTSWKNDKVKRLSRADVQAYERLEKIEGGNTDG